MDPLLNPVLTMSPLVLPKGRVTLSSGSRVDAAYSLLNRVSAALLLLVFSPLMLIIAWRIWREDGAPVLFAHWRVGQNGHLFRCLKFRTMVCNADVVLAELLLRDPLAREEWLRDHKLRDDPRIMRVGRFLRRTSLDELPQLFNVLCGDMNLVGPRPVVVQEVPRYGEHKRHYLSVKPGMTGLWQVSDRNATGFAERVTIDVHYVRNWSPWLDLYVLARTVPVVLGGTGS